MEEVGSIRAGKERASLARCVGRGVGGVGVGMGHASPASYGRGRLDDNWKGTRIASTLCRRGVGGVGVGMGHASLASY